MHGISIILREFSNRSVCVCVCVCVCASIHFKIKPYFVQWLEVAGCIFI
jgi:hypothetical protein